MTHVPAPMTLARLQAALAIAGAAPRKRHGQHFLWRDEHLAQIVERAHLGPGNTVLEVGPGPGLLTRHLLATGARVIAVEIDPAMRRVADQLLEEGGELEWIETDVLEGTRKLAAPVAERLPECTHFVANLPYNVSAPLIALVLGAEKGPSTTVVTVQKEVGARLLSPPGRADYGPLSVQVALATKGEVVRTLAPGCFWPPPRVQSSIIALERLENPPQTPGSKALEVFLGAAFHTRRKTLVNSVATASGCSTREVASRLGLEKKQEKTRAESLTPLQLCALATRWADHAPDERLRP